MAQRDEDRPIGPFAARAVAPHRAFRRLARLLELVVRAERDAEIPRSFATVAGGASLDACHAFWREQSKVPGYRFRLAVADWNDDGNLDLLIGNCGQVDGETTGDGDMLLRQ